MSKLFIQGDILKELPIINKVEPVGRIWDFDFYDMRAACRKYKEQDALLGETA